MMGKEKIIIGCDTSGFPLKEAVLKALKEDGYEVKDVGCYSTDEGYYLDAVEPLCKAVQSGEYGKGILICGTGQGMNISANKFRGIRSTICYNLFTAKMSRADSDANVLCMGAWCIKEDEGADIAKVWLSSDYYDPNNQYGINRMKEFEDAMKQ